MEKTYSAQAIERALYQDWEQSDFFKAHGAGMPYCLMLPPPNVTGSLHMGHGFQQTLMDVLIRYHRMQGDCTLWQPGTDHAGIATQMVVERQLEAEGTSRQALGREDFVKRVWQWKNESGGTISQQMRRLGTSPDWSREGFSMDDNLSHAVREAFVRLYDEGLIYRGKRLVNWDPVLKTAVSDLEVLSEETDGSLWHIRYPIANSSDYVVIATTRPETLLGDAAIAVNPEDTRYQHLIGQMIELPFCDRQIPIISDDYVDQAFGTGCVKITPAHDFNDYDIGKRHDLPQINILTLDAKINSNAPEAYQGLDRFEARQQLLADLKQAGLLDKIEKHRLKIPKSERGGAIIEPMLSDQWYVSTQSLAEPAIQAVKQGKITFIPENASNLYYRWLEDIQDWCISRQLWWGHRIPAWFDSEDNVYVGQDETDVRKKYQLANEVILRQEEDVLDTWFSAALWPFATLGWPEKTPEFSQFYPTSTLITGFDIIFFWVARMIMFGLKFTGEVPFREVYIHGLIRDHDGQKMSKSKGNVLDPVDLIDGIELEPLIAKRTSKMMQPRLKEKIIKATKAQFPEGIKAYGTDALRFTFCALASTSRDIVFDVQRMEGYRNFCNKLWNASRFVLMNLEGQAIQAGELGLTERWIYSRLNHCIQQVHQTIHQYRFDLAAQAIYEFVWNTYCDWYVEFAKIHLQSKINDKAKAAIRYTLVDVLDCILRLAHPIIPFITDSIWQSVKSFSNAEGTSLMRQPYPQVDTQMLDQTVEQQMNWLQQVIVAIRTIRSEMNISPKKQVPLHIQHATATEKTSLQAQQDLLMSLAKIESISWLEGHIEPGTTAVQTVGKLALHIPLAGLIDTDAERQRLQKEMTKLEKELTQLQAKLSNPNFTGRAPEAVVDKVRAKQQLAHNSYQQLQQQLAQLIQYSY